MRKFTHIAELIKRKRLSHPKGLSQSDLSSLLGYKNGQFISNVERALCNIPFKMMNKVCDILHITEEEIKEVMIKDYKDTLDAYFVANTTEALPKNDFNAPEFSNPVINPSVVNNGFGTELN